jgi:hypothetical protein
LIPNRHPFLRSLVPTLTLVLLLQVGQRVVARIPAAKQQVQVQLPL